MTYRPTGDATRVRRLFPPVSVTPGRSLSRWLPGEDSNLDSGIQSPLWCSPRGEGAQEAGEAAEGAEGESMSITSCPVRGSRRRDERDGTRLSRAAGAGLVRRSVV